MKNIEFKCIHYHEEHDTDGSLLEHEWIEEGQYRNGFLIKSVFIDKNNNRSESITFIKNDKEIKK